ncbi:MAG: carbohydrate binding domain-containing protein [Prevotella sp.]|nr:carbohydrate binding domain-containing protein [Prevotella sp.]
MKKIFTLFAVAIMALSVNAQERVLFENGGAYGNGATLTSENTKVVLGNDRATKNYDLKLSTCKAYCAELFGQQVMVENSETGEMEEKTRVVYVVGANNPKDGELDGSDKSSGSGYKPESMNLPQSGCYYMITPAKDGHITAFVIVNSSKNLYVVKSNGECLSKNQLTVKADGEEPTVVTINDDFTLDEKTTGTLEFDVVANETYYVFCTGSKLSFGGYVFTPKADVGPGGLVIDPALPITFDSWDANFLIQKTDVKAGDKFVFTCEPVDVEGWEWGPQVLPKSNADWSDLGSALVPNEEGKAIFKITEEFAEVINGNGGLRVQGMAVKVTAVEFVEGTAPGPEGDHVSIIDKFTYTWNSSESLTHNDDGSITFNAVSWGGLSAWMAENDTPVDWSEYSKIVFEYAEPATVNTQIVVQTVSGDVKAWGEVGITKLECSFEEADVTQVNQVALQCSDVTTLVIKDVYLVKAGGSVGPQPEEGWQELVKNGDVEGEDGTSLITKNGEDGGAFIFNPQAGVGLDGSRAAVVHAVDNAVNEWDSQFFIYAPDHVFAAGEEYKVSFWVRADKATAVSVQAHKKAGEYLHWAVITNGETVNIPTEWTEVTYQGTVSAEQDGMQTIAFNLNQDKTLENNYYFDNVSWKVKVDETGVKEINNPKQQMNGQKYNLAGMRVGDDYKGIVIQNGRKFIQK